MLLEKLLVFFSYATQTLYESSTSEPTTCATISHYYHLRVSTSPVILLEITIKAIPRILRVGAGFRLSTIYFWGEHF